MFFRVVEIDDLGRTTEVLDGEVPDPRCVFAEHYNLLGPSLAAAAGLGVDQRTEVLGGLQGREVAGRAWVEHRVAVMVNAGLGG